MSDRKPTRAQRPQLMRRTPGLSARPQLMQDGMIPRRTPEAELNRPPMQLPRVSLKRRETIDAAAELDRMCAARPKTPPPLPSTADTRGAGACALARDIRRGVYRP